MKRTYSVKAQCVARCRAKAVMTTSQESIIYTPDLSTQIVGKAVSKSRKALHSLKTCRKYGFNGT